MTTFLRFKVLIVFCFLFSAQSYANVNTYHSFSYYFTTVLQKVLVHYIYGEEEVKPQVLENTNQRSALVPSMNCHPPFTIYLDEYGNATITIPDINNGSEGEGTLNLSLSLNGDLSNPVNEINFDCDDIGSFPVYLIGTDDIGTDSCSSTVTVEEYQSSSTVSISFDVGSPTICSGESVTFSASTSATDYGTTPIFNWKINGADPVSGAESGTTFTTDQLNNGDVVTVEMTSSIAGNCSPIIVSNSIAMTVNNSPVVSFSIEADDTEICDGDTVEFSIDGVITNGGPTTGRTYQWYKNGSPITGADEATYSTSDINDGDAFTLEFYSPLTCAIQQSGSNSIQITVNPLPSISLSSDSADQTVCIDTPVSAIEYTIGGTATNATVSGLPPGVSYSVSSNILTISGTPTTANNYTYTITTTGGACSPPATATGTISVTPNASISLSSGSLTQEICEGQTITPIVFNIEGSGDNYELTGLPADFDVNFSSNTVSISGGASASYSVDPYPFTIKATGGCENSNTLNGSITINENLTPAVSISAPLASAPFCEGTNVTFTATPTNGGTPSYQWKVNGSNVGSNTNSFSSATLTDGDEVTVEMTSSETCVTTATVTSNTITVNVFDKITPEVTITSNDSDNIICAGTSVTFTATPINPGTSPTYEWKVGSSVVGSGSSYTTSSLTDGQVVTLTMISSETCVTSSTAVDNINMTVNPILTPEVEIENGITSIDICEGTYTFNITNTTNGGSSPTYQWKVGSSVVGSGTSFSPTNLTEGDIVTVEMTSSEDCVNTTAVSNAVEIHNFTPIIPPSIISGDENICPPASRTYSVPLDPNVLSYQWTVPSGVSITSGQNTNEITVYATNPGSASQVSVTLTNACGSETLYLTLDVDNFIFVDLSPEDIFICEGTPSVNLTASIAGLIDRRSEIEFSADIAGVSVPTYNGNGPLDSVFSIDIGNLGSLSGGTSVTITMASTINDPCSTGNSTIEDTMQIHILEIPTASIAITGDSQVCSGSASNVTITGTPNTTVGYTVNGTTQSVAIGNTGSVSLPTANLTTETTYELTSVGYTNTPTCNQNFTDDEEKVTISILPDATLTNPTNNINQTICADSAIDDITFTFGGGAADVNLTGALPAGVTFDPTSHTISGTPTVTGTFDYTVSTTGTCAQTDMEGSITIIAKPVVEAGNTTLEVCFGDSITLDGSLSAGTNAVWSGAPSGDFSNINSPTATFTPSLSLTSNSETITLTLSSTNATAPCGEKSDTVDIIVYRTPVVEAGENVTICAGESVTLNGSFSEGASSASWLTSSNGSFTSGDLSPITEFTPSITDGTVTLTLRSDDPTGPCGSVEDTMTITVNPLPTVFAGNDITVCEGDTIDLEGTFGGAATSASWSATSDGSFTNINSPTSKFTPNISSGQITLTLTTNDPSGACTAVSDEVIITVNPEPTLSITGDSEICSNNTASIEAVLGGSATGVGGTWTSSGNGSFLSGNTTATNTYELGPQDLNKKTVTLTYTSNSPTSPCNIVSQDFVITIKDEIEIGTQPQNIGVCASNSATFGVYDVIGDFEGTDFDYQWYKVNSPSDTPISGATSNEFTINNASMSDSGSYYVIITGANACSTLQSDIVSLNVNQVITINNQPSSSPVCQATPVTLSVSATGAIDTYTWYEQGNSTPLISGINASSFTPDTSSPGTRNYYVVISSSGGYCNEITSNIVPVEVNETPVATLAYADSPYCTSQGDITPDAFTSNYTTGANKGTFTATGGLTINPDTGVITPNVTGSFTITYTIPAQGGCTELTLTETITIEVQPLADISYPDTAYCTSEAPVNVSLQTITGGEYTVDKSGLAIDANTGTITPGTSTPDTYVVTYTLAASGNCNASTASTTVTIDPLLDATFNFNGTSGALAVCENSGNVNLNFATGISGTDGNLTVTEPGTSTPKSGLVFAGNSTINIAASTPGTYDVTFSIDPSAGCAGDFHTETITIDPVSVGGTLEGYALMDDNTQTETSNNIIACHSGDGTLTVSDYSGNVIGWEISTDAGLNWTFVTGNSANDYEYDFSGITETTLYRAVIQSGSCDAVNSSITFVNVIPPDIKPTPVVATPDYICVGSTIQFTAQSGFGTGGGLIPGGDFNQANPPGWLVDGEEKMPANGDNTQPSYWAETNGPKTFSGTTYDSPDKKFAIVNGDIGRPTTLETPVFNTIGLSTANFEFDRAYKLESGAYLKMELSIDGGANYNILLEEIYGPANSGNHIGLNASSIDLNAYIGQPNLRIKFTFLGTANSSAAMDNFVLPDRPLEEDFAWVDGNDQFITNEENFTFTPTEPGTFTYYVTSFIKGCRSTIEAGGYTAVTFHVYEQEIATATGKTFADVECGVTTFELTGNSPIIDDYHASGGEWTVTSATGTYTIDDITNPNAILKGEPGQTYNLTWTITQNEDSPCDATTADIEVVFLTCDDLDFDGTDDHVVFGDTYNFTGNFTIETWVRRTKNSYPQTIISKRNGIDNSGYDLSFNSATQIAFNYNGSSLTSAYLGDTNWHHLAITYDGEYKIYIDGILGSSGGSGSPSTNTADNLLGTHHVIGDIPQECFGGKIDELRYWDTALTLEQIQEMMNQEITAGGGTVTGNVLQSAIQGLNSANLIGYYQLDTNTELSAGYLLSTGIGPDGLLKNITSTLADNAPLPFQTINGGSWDTSSTWLNGNVQYIPNTTGIGGTSIDWNIVRTSHNVTTSRSTAVLGLLIDANTLTVDNDSPFYINKYVIIDGIMDMLGESQLLQPEGSILDNSGVGNLRIRQQGTSNAYNYNYWTSPVNIDGSTFNLAGILHDGTGTKDINPEPVQWTSGYDGSPTDPITISTRWLYTFNDLEGLYANWQKINQNTAVPISIGYLMKGSGSNNAPSGDQNTQNYVFIGQPNNGDYTPYVHSGNRLFTGNPYPSALDADTFLSHNSSATTGAIYIFEQAPSNYSHYVAQYLGGYAIYALGSGGVAPVAIPSNQGQGDASKIPQRYIPIAQGFEVIGNETGGDVYFNNSDRFFQKESDGQSVFLKTTAETNKEKDEETEPVQRVRIDFKNPDKAVRHLLLAFTPDNAATDGVDYGYDAINIDNFPCDMFFIIDGEKYVIQGVGEFDETKRYPLGIFLDKKGDIEISLDTLENFDPLIDVYIYDNVLDTYTRINESKHQQHLEKGDHVDRFFLTFSDDDKLDIIENELQDITINYLDNTDEIHIKTPSHISLKQVNLINTLGQTVKAWNTTNAPLSNNCKIPVKNISEGNYIVTVKTENGSISKKVIVQF